MSFCFLLTLIWYHFWCHGSSRLNSRTTSRAIANASQIEIDRISIHIMLTQEMTHRRFWRFWGRFWGQTTFCVGQGPGDEIQIVLESYILWGRRMEESRFQSFLIS
jgi:hypothetical protein